MQFDICNFLVYHQFMIESGSHQAEIPLSFEARNVVIRAKGLAYEYGHDYLASIHLFCVLLEDNGVIQAMANLGVDAPKLKGTVSAMMERFARKQSHLPEQILEEVNQVYGLADQEAKRVRQSEVSQLHLLTGLFRQEHCAAWWLMEINGLGLTQLRQQEKWLRTAKKRFDSQAVAKLQQIRSDLADPTIPQATKQKLYAGLVRLTKDDITAPIPSKQGD